MMFAIFGQITINDAMVARYTNAGWRARAYAVRYLLSFGVSASAVPLVALMHRTRRLHALFQVLAISGALVKCRRAILSLSPQRAARPHKPFQQQAPPNSFSAPGLAGRTVGGAAQHHSRQGAGVVRILDDDDAVDQDASCACRSDIGAARHRSPGP